MQPFQQTQLPAHVKRPQGRPTEYKPEYDTQVIESMRQGISLAGFAGVIGVARDTVYEWMKVHASFSDAVSRARSAQQLFWELKLTRSKKGAETSASMFALKNIDPMGWRDVRSVDHQHTLKAEQLTDAQLHAIAARKVNGSGAVIDGDYEVTDTR